MDSNPSFLNLSFAPFLTSIHPAPLSVPMITLPSSSLDMTIKEQIRLRIGRKNAATRKGKKKDEIEMVSVYTCEKHVAKPCNEFVYLGSKVDVSLSATPEIKRRIRMAMSTFGSMNKVWKSRDISSTTKEGCTKQPHSQSCYITEKLCL